MHFSRIMLLKKFAFHATVFHLFFKFSLYFFRTWPFLNNGSVVQKIVSCLQAFSSALTSCKHFFGPPEYIGLLHEIITRRFKMTYCRRVSSAFHGSRLVPLLLQPQIIFFLAHPGVTFWRVRSPGARTGSLKGVCRFPARGRCFSSYATGIRRWSLSPDHRFGCKTWSLRLEQSVAMCQLIKVQILFRYSTFLQTVCFIGESRIFLCKLL